jgi:hypothetical protein
MGIAVYYGLLDGLILNKALYNSIFVTPAAPLLREKIQNSEIL